MPELSVCLGVPIRYHSCHSIVCSGAQEGDFSLVATNDFVYFRVLPMLEVVVTVVLFKELDRILADYDLTEFDLVCLAHKRKTSPAPDDIEVLEGIGRVPILIIGFYNYRFSNANGK